MKHILKIVGFGFLVWLIPFIAAFFFFSPEGGLVIDKTFFKTIMLLVSNIFGMWFLVMHFKKQHANYIREGVLVGMIWLIVNWLLDFAVLIPMSQMDISTYFKEIGLRYILMPVASITFGYLCQAKQGE